MKKRQPKQIDTDLCPNDSVKRSIKYGYGTGHVMNDMSGTLWTTYLLLVLMNVIEIGTVNSGMVLFAGQIGCGISTVVVGIISDKELPFNFCIRYGKRKVNELLKSLNNTFID